MLDKILFPEIMIHSRPCKLNSQEVYDIVRQCITEQINHDVATIESNYDFCFKVNKIITSVRNNLFHGRASEPSRRIFIWSGGNGRRPTGPDDSCGKGVGAGVGVIVGVGVGTSVG